MSEKPETGLWGPGDYDQHATIDVCREYLAPHPGRYDVNAEIELCSKVAVRDAFLDLAEDLDARGLVLVSEDELDRIFSKGWGAGFDFTIEHPEPPSSPNTGS